MSESSSVIELFQRIHRSKIRDEQNIHLARLKSQCLCLLFTVFLLYITQCHIRIYNAWNGPFHMNFNEFTEYWKIYSGNVANEKSFLSDLFSLKKEYLQVEFGQNKIDHNPKHIFHVYHGFPTQKNLIYTFHSIKDQNITTIPMQLYVKLPMSLQSKFHQRFPYRFDLFSSNTLECIVQQLDISLEVYYSYWKDSTHIRLIDKIYDKNVTDFNMKVISKCGILIGYLYDYPNEIVFSKYTNQSYKFTNYVAIFDSYSSYSPYITYVFGGVILSCSLIEIFFELNSLVLVFIRCNLHISRDAQRILNMFNIGSIRRLDYFLIITKKENNCRNQIFLVHDRYLIIFKISLNECNPEILRQFVKTAPFEIIDIEHITAINSDYISISNGASSLEISLPRISDNNNIDTVNWLHRRLIDCSTTYRLKVQKRDHLANLINEERQIQQIMFVNNPEWMYDRPTAVLPCLIAQFRLNNARTVNAQLAGTICALCLEVFQLEDLYSQWPCTGQHVFHHNCMLNVLRRQNQCPLCRYIFKMEDLSLADADSESDYEVE